ncbi:MAG: hypothetical protein ACLRZG_06900 [Streptococcus sp.]
MLESNTADGGGAYYGFYKGNLSMDAIDLNTIKDKADELATTDVSFMLQAQALMSKPRTSTVQCTLVAMKQKSRN